MMPSKCSEGLASTVSCLPLAILELIATFCSPAAAAAARLVCLAWGCTFSVAQDSLRLDTQRPTAEAAALLGVHAFPLAHRATLVLAATPVAGSQAQVDAWLHALCQRTAITQLTLSSAAEPAYPGLLAQRLPAQRLLATLGQLSSLRHLQALTLDLTQAWCQAGCVAVGQLTLLTRLQVATLRSADAARQLAASLRLGLPHLRAVELGFGTFGREAPPGAAVKRLLQAVAEGCPQLGSLGCRGRDPPTMLAEIICAFGPAAVAHVDITCTADSRSIIDRVIALRSRSGSAALATTLHVVALAVIKRRDAAACRGGPGGESFTIAGAAVCDATHLLQYLKLPPLAATHSLEDVTYTVPRQRNDPFLNLTELPPGLVRLAFRIREVQDWPPISGTAPALTALELSWRYQRGNARQGAALAALAAGCANLTSLTLLCDGSAVACATAAAGAAAAAAAWAPLAGLRRLAHLCISGRTETLGDRTFCAAWLPHSLESLRLEEMQVIGGGVFAVPHCLPQLLSVHLEGCSVDDLRVLGPASSLRRLTLVSSSVRSGGDALLSFSELEELWETECGPCAGAFVQAAVSASAAASAAAAAADNLGVGGMAPLMPRLRRLSLSSTATTAAAAAQPPVAVHDLLRRLPHLRNLCLVSCGGGGGAAEVARIAADLRPLSRLTDLTLLEVSGVSDTDEAGMVQQLRATLPCLTVVAVASGCLPSDQDSGGGTALEDLRAE